LKPAAFKYLRPESIGDALALLALHRDDARIIAGGQSLVPMLNFRIARYDFLIDINGISELSFIKAESDSLRIGALTRYHAIESSPEVSDAAPLLRDATKWVAHRPIRARGTIGGSLSHADPAAEYPPVMIALEAKFVVRSASSQRSVHADEFFTGIFSTVLEPDEMLTEIQIPRATSNHFFAIEEFSRRPGDLAVIGVVVNLGFSGKRVQSARLVAFGLGGGPCRITEAETHLIGRELSQEQVESASMAAASISAQSDNNATSELRKKLACVLTRRALLKVSSAQMGQQDE